jgi:predicted ArsR family transcriptional regulator
MAEEIVATTKENIVKVLSKSTFGQLSLAYIHQQLSITHAESKAALRELVKEGALERRRENGISIYAIIKN